MDAPTAGILKNSTALTPPGGPGAAPPPDDSESPQGEPATPEEEAQMQQFLDLAKKAMYGTGGKNPNTDSTLERLRSGDPVQALADASLNIFREVAGAAEKGGVKLDPSVLFNGGYMIVKDIADFSTEVSKQQGTPAYNDKMITGAYLHAVDQYRTVLQQQGLISQDVARQDWGNFSQADQAGNPDAVLPHAKEAAQLMKPAADVATHVMTTGQAPAPAAGDEGGAAAPGGDDEEAAEGETDGKPASPEEETAEGEDAKAKPSQVRAKFKAKAKKKKRGRR